MELESGEAGHGLNIPGRVVGRDYTCKEMVRVNAFMGGLSARTCPDHSWPITGGP